MTSTLFSEGVFNQNIYTYTWTGLSAAGFLVDFLSGGVFGSLDGFQGGFSHQAIRKTSTYALLGMYLAELVWLQRRGVSSGYLIANRN